MTNSLVLDFLGGAGQIGGNNCATVTVSNTCLMFDRGQRPDSKGKSGLKVPGKLDGLFVTHGHADHCLGVPELAEELGTGIPTYMTEPTYQFAYSNWVTKLEHEMENDWAAFSMETLFDYLNNIEIIKSRQELGIGNVTVRVIGVNHILGAVGFHLTVKTGTGEVKIFFTGDYSLSDTKNPLIPEFDISYLKGNVDILVSGGTYAGAELPKLSDEVARFGKTLNSYIEKDYRILIPSFAVDRAQKLDYILSLLGLRPITYIDGGAQRWFSTYKEYGKIPIEAYGDRFLGKWSEAKVLRSRLMKTRPLIVLASAGMVLKNSCSYLWADEFIEDEKSAIIFPGYQAPDTLGGQILKAKSNGKKVMFGSKEKEIKAAIEKFQFSGHVRSPEIASFIKHCNPSVTFLTHCNPDSANKFIAENPDLPGEVIVAENKKYVL